MNGVNLSHAKLVSIATSRDGPFLDMAGASLIGAKITDATIDGANWAKTTLSRAKLNGSIIIAYMVGAKLNGADLTNAKLYSDTWRSADFSGAIFCHTQILGTGENNSGCPKPRKMTNA